MMSMIPSKPIFSIMAVQMSECASNIGRLIWNIEKCYYQLVLLKLKLIVINIGVCNVTGHIPDLNTNFLLVQAYIKNVSTTYVMLTISSLTTSNQWETQWKTQWGKTTSTWFIHTNLIQIIKFSKNWYESNKSKKYTTLFFKVFWCKP